MTEEQHEDVKPKINLVVDFEGQSEYTTRRKRLPRRVWHEAGGAFRNLAC